MKIVRNIIDNAPFAMIMKLSDNLDYHENEGYLYCYNVIMGRTGVQQYRAYELGLEGNDIIDVYRDEADVFHEDTIKSLIGKSVVYNHPIEGDVTSQNYKRLEAGTVLDAWRDGENIVGNIVVKDAITIQAIQNGVRELSLGYNATIVEEDGKYYQKEIRMNHLAVLEAGRAGNARIIDRKGVDETVPEKNKLSFMERVKSLFAVKDGEIVEANAVDNENNPTLKFTDVELNKGERFSFSDGKRVYIYNDSTVTTEIYDEETGVRTEETISITKRIYKRLDENGQPVKGFYDEDGNLITDIDSIKVIDAGNENNQSITENNNKNNENEEGDDANMKLSFKDAMAEYNSLLELPNSEFRKNAIEELNARAIADGLGSILPIEPEKPKEEGKKTAEDGTDIKDGKVVKKITDTADPANNIVDKIVPPLANEKYNFDAETKYYNNFFKDLLAVNHKNYDEFKDHARKYVDIKDKDIAEGVI